MQASLTEAGAETDSDEIRTSLTNTQELIAELPNLPHLNIYVEEAEFGLRYIEPEILKLRPGARVLEVGSGACLLLNEISLRNPELCVAGIEPAATGFEILDRFIEELLSRNARINLHRCGYEEFESDEKFDLIYLVNVFEHLPDWRDFLKFVESQLSDDGVCVILCPNYNFPYESHFSIPIIINKSITRKLFSKHINKFEEDNSCDGLWTSLNFVTYSQVRKAVRERKLELDSSPAIVEDMINRLDTDENFARRHRSLSIPARLALKTGILRFLVRLGPTRHVLPYLHMTLRRAR